MENAFPCVHGIALADPCRDCEASVEMICPNCRVERADYAGPNAHLDRCPNCQSKADPMADCLATEEGGPDSDSKPAPIPDGEPQNRVPDSVQKKGKGLNDA